MSEIQKDIGPEPKLEWIDVNLIDVDHNYQREADGKRVQQILASFRWDHFGAVVLAPAENGRFRVTDGQHRAAAAKLHPSISRVPALVISGNGMVAEAENFLVINRARKAVTPIETFWAGLAAGDPQVQRIKDVLDRAGCEVVAGPGAYRPGHTNAVGALERSIKRYGDAATVRALEALRRAYPNDAHALRGTLITAIARINRNNEKLDQERLARVLSGMSFAEMTAHAESFRKLSGGSAETALAKTITESYNKGLSANTIYFGAAA